ncbi:MAG: acyl carrier protein [Clostridia bacterium]
MVLEKIKKLIATQLGINESKIQNNSRIVEDLGADSLDTVEMLMTLEEEFGISIPDEDTNSLKTFGSIVDYINSKIAK